MNRNTIWLAAVLLIVYLTLVFCEETENAAQESETDMDTDDWESTARDLLEIEGRTRRRRRHHHLWYRHLWPLAIAYWIKVKVVIVSFFVGSAIYLGLRYFWPHKCHQEIILDHPPPSFNHHDHIPYSLDHSDHYEHDHYDSSPTSFDSSSFEPYSGYSGYSGGSPDIVSDVSGDIHGSSPSAPSGPSAAPSLSDIHRRGRRSIEDDEAEEADEEISESIARQMPAEEQIADFMFAFLGLDSKACRRRFICEMEFRSKNNPITSMAFRIVGRGFFEKYTNANNQISRATNFAECAAVNPECIFIENTNPEEQDGHQATAEEAANVVEAENLQNLQAERRHAKLRSQSSVAKHILAQSG